MTLLLSAVEDFLAWGIRHKHLSEGGARVYRSKLTMYAGTLGPERTVRGITGNEWYEACNLLWEHRAPETYNSARTAALSFLAYCRKAGIAKPRIPGLWMTKRVPKNRSRALPRPVVERITENPDYQLRERSLWRFLYESSERLDAVLHLDIETMDLDRRYAEVQIKGGDTRYIVWAPYGNQLLLEYFGARRSGPAWVTERRPSNWRDVQAGDRLEDGRCRLTADWARRVYRKRTGLAKVHRVRHSRLQDLGEQATSSVMMKAISGHESDKTLVRYSTPGPDSVARFMAAEEEQRRLERSMSQ